jgi:hypothetical protein
MISLNKELPEILDEEELSERDEFACIIDICIGNVCGINIGI